MSDKNCPSQNDFSSFLASALSENKRETFELHLANCMDCRRNLSLMFSENTENFVAPDSLKEKVKNLPAKAKSASFNPFAWFKNNRLQLAFAATLLVCFGFVGLYVWQSQKSANSDDVLRNGSANKTAVKLLAPEDNTNISVEKITFRWSEIPNAKNYTLILSDEKGDIVKEILSEKPIVETSISALGLTKEKRYFWHLKAKFADGTTAESESRKIFIARK